MRNSFLIFFSLVTTTVAQDVSFSRQLVPILVRRCLGCHDNRKTEGRYALHTYEMLLQAGDSEETPVVPGSPDQSYLFAKLTDADPDSRMPQEDDPLSPAEIRLFEQWIRQGAKFDGKLAADRLVTLLPPRRHPAPPTSYRTAIPVFALAFSRDGRSLYTGGWHELLVRDVASGQLKQRLAGLPQRIHCIRFSPDGQTLAVAGGAPGEYGEIRLIDLKGFEHQSPRQHVALTVWEDVIFDLAFSADGKTLIAGGADNSVRAYDLATRTEAWRNTQHADWVTAVDVTDYRFTETQVPNKNLSVLFTLNEHELKSGSHLRQHWQFPGGKFIVHAANWELEAGDSLSHSNGNGDSAGKSPTAESLTRITVTGIGKSYQVQRETYSGDALQEFQDIIQRLRELHATWPADPAGDEFVVSSSRDRTVKVFTRSDGRLFTTYKGHRREYGPLAGLHRVFGVQTQPGTRRVWSAGEGDHFHGWNPVTVRDEDGTAADMEARFAKEYSIDLIRHDLSEPVFALQRRGDRLLAASASGAVHEFAIGGEAARFDVNEVATLRSHTGHNDHLFAIDSTIDEKLIAAAGFTGEVIIWNRATGEIISRFLAAPVELNAAGR